MLLDKMCKYEMDPDRVDTILSRRTDGQTDGQGETSIPPSTSFSGGDNELLSCCHMYKIMTYNITGIKIRAERIFTRF